MRRIKKKATGAHTKREIERQRDREGLQREPPRVSAYLRTHETHALRAAGVHYRRALNAAGVNYRKAHSCYFKRMCFRSEHWRHSC